MQSHPQSSGRIVQACYWNCVLPVVSQLVAISAAPVSGPVWQAPYHQLPIIVMDVSEDMTRITNWSPPAVNAANFG